MFYNNNIIVSVNPVSLENLLYYSNILFVTRSGDPKKLIDNILLAKKIEKSNYYDNDVVTNAALSQIKSENDFYMKLLYINYKTFKQNLNVISNIIVNSVFYKLLVLLVCIPENEILKDIVKVPVDYIFIDPKITSKERKTLFEYYGTSFVSFENFDYCLDVALDKESFLVINDNRRKKNETIKEIQIYKLDDIREPELKNSVINTTFLSYLYKFFK